MRGGHGPARRTRRTSPFAKVAVLYLVVSTSALGAGGPAGLVLGARPPSALSRVAARLCVTVWPDGVSFPLPASARVEGGAVCRGVPSQAGGGPWPPKLHCPFDAPVPRLEPPSFKGVAGFEGILKKSAVAVAVLVSV